VLVSLYFFSPLFGQAEPLNVSVVLSEQGASYQEFSDALREELKKEQVVLKVLDVGDATGKNDLIVAVGMRAATESVTSNVPVLNVLVPKANYDKLVKSTSKQSAIYLDQPIERQLSLLIAALPKVKHIGVLYSTPPAGLATLRRLIAEKKMILDESVVGQEIPLSDALESVLSESEVLLVLPDANVYNAGTIRNILLTSYRKQIPLIGISQAYVKAGALCAVYSTPTQIARQTAEAIRQFADTKKLPPGQYSKEFEVSVNLQVARSLDFQVKDAEKLRVEMRRAP
jgi:ABC-type uncharacterized transport system substrate-binding protein